MPSRKLCVLFDIDGTLLITDVGRVTLREALREVSHVQDPFCEIRFGGRTDRSIVTELLERNRLPVTEEMFNAVRDSYLRHLPGAITQSDGVLLPGVQELLIRLQGDPRVVLFAMTGNFSAAAKVKLTYFGLQDYFEAVFGGDHDHRRNDLAKHTLEKIRSLRDWSTTSSGRKVDGSNVSELDEAESSEWVTIRDKIEFDTVVVGDTPADIECSQAIGARCLAVCTGGYSMDELKCHSPDSLFSDLKDQDKVIEALFG